MTRFTSSLFALFAGLNALKHVQAGVTIYQPVPTDPALLGPAVNQPKIIGVSAIALASDGATQYAATEVATAFAAGGTTVTFSPTTFVVTFEEGASTYHVSQASATTIAGHAVTISQNIACGPGNGNLDCVEIGKLSIQGALPATTVTTSFVATASPIFTITGDVVAPLSTAKSGTIRAAPFVASTSLFMGFVYILARIF